MSKIAQTCAVLDKCGVVYEYVGHPAVMTVDEFRLQQAYGMGVILKNLFLRDNTGTKTFMFSCHGERRADLKKLAQALGVKKLAFGSPEQLMHCTGLTPGAVSPLGLLFDSAREVTMVFDAQLRTLSGKVGVHPGENTATVFLEFGALVRLLEDCGVNVLFAEITSPRE